MADIVETLGKLKDEMIKADMAYRKIEIVAKEKMIEADLVASIKNDCLFVNFELKFVLFYYS